MKMERLSVRSKEIRIVIVTVRRNGKMFDCHVFWYNCEGDFYRSESGRSKGNWSAIGFPLAHSESHLNLARFSKLLV